MSLSGVAVNPECVTTYEETKSQTGELAFAIYKIVDGEFVVHHSFPRSELHETSFDKFHKYLTDNLKTPFYASLVVKSNRVKEGRIVEKMIFITYIPENHCSIKEKMLYSSSKDALKKAVSSFNIEIHANDEDALEPEEVQDRVEKAK
ncbi:uncharacterized protein LOC141909837 isoform X2 [Tubulanus polymorphus]|uniref:uncharacterized protein LOC141909837 isoform X2 n=1 Tax=Tubulanus polymorphus TaxID=672921 RepID=UPI003DA619B5